MGPGARFHSGQRLTKDLEIRRHVTLNTSSASVSKPIFEQISHRFRARKSTTLQVYRRAQKLVPRALSREDVGDMVGRCDRLLSWCTQQGNMEVPKIEAGSVKDEFLGEQELGLVTKDKSNYGEILAKIPGNLAVTLADVRGDEMLSELIEGRSELIALALFILKERSIKEKSYWSPLIESLPAAVDNPIVWPDEIRAELLRGSPTLQECRDRQRALTDEWNILRELMNEKGGEEKYPKSVFNTDAFMSTMTVVLSHAIYLPSAECFALLPLLGNMSRTGSSAGAVIDYDFDLEAVTLTASQSYSVGEEVRAYDGRSNAEMFLATGKIESSNPSDYLILNASLVPADRLYQLKKDVLAEFGFGPSEQFPVFDDRIATQHLAYLRLSRLTDSAQIAKVSFTEDIVISPENEYEVLQLLMSDLRDLTQGYDGNLEDDVKELQRSDLDMRARIAAALRYGEKRIIQGTMTGIRKRLAPIRGIPTKSGGLEDPNADLLEVFETIESIPKAPLKLFEGLASWARGDSDPDWKKR